ncbi:MAG: ATP-binding protein [Pyrinomonadaceae bacterium]
MSIQELKLPSRLESIDQAVIAVTEYAARAGFADDALFAVDLALRETVTNAVKHGNEFDETKDVVLTFEAVGDALEITVRDFGKGFAVEEVPDPTNPENLLKATGRGILFMNNFMDTVEWENAAGGGTLVRLRKKR